MLNSIQSRCFRSQNTTVLEKRKEKETLYLRPKMSVPASLWLCGVSSGLFFFEVIYDVLHNDLGHRRQS